MPARQKFSLKFGQQFRENLGGTARLKSVFLLIIAFSAIFLFLPRAVFAQNLLQNPGFEELLLHWETYSGAGALIVDNQVRSGKYAVRVQNDSTRSCGVQQLITGITEGKTYRFSGYGKKTDPNVAEALLRIAWYKSGSSSQMSTVDSNQITEVGDWAELTVEKMAPPDATSAKVRAVLATKTDGTQAFAYFDDLEFSEVISLPTPTPTPTPTSSPTTATYKINEVKDEGGEILSNVWVYVDGEYTHHYAPETLTFGDGKYCDDNKEVECGFGEHTIRLEKSGYEDWSETITISSGYYDEVNPVMDLKSSDSPSATSTPTPTPVSGSPTPTKKPTPTKTPTPTPSGEILGEEATPEAEVISFNLSQESAPSSFNLQNFLPFIFIGLGSLLLAVAGGSVLLPQIKKKYNIKKRGENKPII